MAYYPSIPASDGTSMEARENSEFQVFEVYDTARATPLRLLSTAGTNAAPLVTTAQGVVPPVEVVSPNVSHVFKSGAWEWRRDSFDGAEVAVKEARNAAGVAASAADSSRRAAEGGVDLARTPTDESVDRGIQRANLPTLAARAVAANDTVVEAAVVAVSSTLTAAGVVHGRAASEAVTDSAWALTTEQGVALPLGFTPEKRLDKLTRRVFTEDLLPVEVDAKWAVGASWVPTFPRADRFAAWGSSSIAGLSSSMTTDVRDSYAGTYFNGGGSGQITPHILARMGVRPAVVGAGVIPASGSVTLPVLNWPSAATTSFSYPCTISGIPGNVSRSSGSGSITFTRTSSGSAVNVPEGSEVIPDAVAERDAVTILNIGKNDLTNSAGAWPLGHVMQATRMATRWLVPQRKRFLVVGHFVNTNTPASDPARSNINMYNEWARREYGPLFVDWAAYVTSPTIFADLKITPTADDLAQQALGNKPPSVSTDDLHLSGSGSWASTTRMIRPVLQSLWYK